MTLLKDLNYLASENQYDYYLSKSSVTWYEAYDYSKKIDWNLLVLKDPVKILNFLDFLTKSNNRQTYWVNKSKILKIYSKFLKLDWWR